MAGRLAFISLWLGLNCWNLTSVPGMAMDEAWSMTSARGLWPPVNPLSGMTPYAGPFPVLLLRLFGADHGVLVLRATSLIANSLMLIAIWRLLRRFSGRALPFWGMPLIATCPVWLACIRTGIEVTMFTPALAVGGLYQLTRRTKWSSFLGGFAWGLLVYNHLLGAYFIPAAGLAWLACYRRLPRVGWLPALAGLAMGIAPRILALAIYPDHLEGSGASYDLLRGVQDLRWLPKGLWETLLGETVFLRYVGHLSTPILPYWSLALLLLVPWLWRWRAIPRHVWFTLLTAILFSVIATVGAPYLAVRFFVLPVVGLAACTVLLAAATLARRDRWVYLPHAVGISLACGNLYYAAANFYAPWGRDDLAVSAFFLGERSPHTGSWGFLPKDELARALRQIEPQPEQVLAPPALQRQLQAILHDTPLRIGPWDVADVRLKSIFVDFTSGNPRESVCLPEPGGSMCFQRAGTIAKYFELYR